MLTAFSLFLTTAATIIFFSRRSLGYLRYFQECKYCSRRFKDWLLKNRIYDKKGSLIITVAALMLELIGKREISSLVICTVAAIALIWLGFWEKDPHRFGSPKLRSTKQAKAIYNLALSLYSIALILCTIAIHAALPEDRIGYYWIAIVIAIQSSPIWLILANTILKLSS